MQRHVRTLTKQNGRNRVPEFELFEVQVPVETAMKGIKYGAPIEVVDPVVIPRSVGNKFNDAKRAKVGYILTVSELKIKGGCINMAITFESNIVPANVEKTLGSLMFISEL